MRSLVTATLSAAAVICGSTGHAADENERQLAEQGFLLVKKYCYDCHGVTFNGSATFIVVDREGLLNSETRYVVAGKPDESYLWQRIAGGEMPPEGQPQPSESEKATIRRWIEAGAPKPEREQRPFKSDEQVLTEILEDLRHSRQADRPYLRYFTMAHLFNNREDVSEFDLRLYRAAFSKAINSLSWEPEIVLPETVDAEQTIFRIDLRDVGWGSEDWGAILGQYSYGLVRSHHEDPEIVERESQLQLLSGTPLMAVRADWFIVTATRPPLYNRLLNIPRTDEELEARLRVDTMADFRLNRVRRAGFAESGVSTANRLVDRHPASFGYYWKSYDFTRDNPRANLFQKPLGPRFDGNAFQRFAFEHDGGEQIFSLPNRLQGYMLIDGVGRRIDEGPIDVVRDLKETSGSPVVVNGISCMHCHQHGMIRFRDTVRSGAAVLGNARQKVQELYPVASEMDRLIERDRARFLRALQEATGPFLQVGDDAGKPIEQFAEPIGAIARMFNRDVSLDEAAFELGMEHPESLKSSIEANPQLRRLGLAPLAEGNAIERSAWQSQENGVSPFQKTARILGKGTPLVFLDE